MWQRSPMPSSQGGSATSNSTTDGYIPILGPNSWARIARICKSQAAVSHFSTESESVALDHVLRSEGIPVLGRWQFRAENLCEKRGAEGPVGARRTPMVLVFEDSEAAIKTTLKKISMVLPHVLRTHRVVFDRLFAFITEGFNSG